MIILIFGIPVAMLTLLLSDIIAEHIARRKLKSTITATRAAAPASVINNFPILKRGF